jgi:hypothetical protein
MMMKVNRQTKISEIGGYEYKNKYGRKDKERRCKCKESGEGKSMTLRDGKKR